jgi:hypothetical protein
MKQQFGDVACSFKKIIFVNSLLPLLLNAEGVHGHQDKSLIKE